MECKRIYIQNSEKMIQGHKTLKQINCKQPLLYVRISPAQKHISIKLHEDIPKDY